MKIITKIPVKDLKLLLCYIEIVSYPEFYDLWGELECEIDENNKGSLVLSSTLDAPRIQWEDWLKEPNSIIDSIEQKIEQKIEPVEQKIEPVEQKIEPNSIIDSIEQKIEQKIEPVEQKIEPNSIIDSIEQKIEPVEQKIEPKKTDYFTVKNIVLVVSTVGIALSSILFDLDGWRKFYTSIEKEIVGVIISIYFAKAALVDIIQSYSKIFSIRTILISIWSTILLLGIILTSLFGIYSSVSMNTMGDIKTIQQFDINLSLIDTEIDTKKSTLVQFDQVIDKTEGVIAKERRLKEASDLRTEIVNLEKDKHQIIVNKTQMEMSFSSRGASFIAEMFNIPLISLVKWVSILFSVTLEFLYLLLLWKLFENLNKREKKNVDKT